MSPVLHIDEHYAKGIVSGQGIDQGVAVSPAWLGTNGGIVGDPVLAAAVQVTAIDLLHIVLASHNKGYGAAAIGRHIKELAQYHVNRQKAGLVQVFMPGAAAKILLTGRADLQLVVVARFIVLHLQLDLRLVGLRFRQ